MVLALCGSNPAEEQHSPKTAGGADKDGLLTRTAKGVISPVQNLLPSPTHKESVCGVQKASRLGATLQTTGIGTIYGLPLHRPPDCAIAAH